MTFTSFTSLSPLLSPEKTSNHGAFHDWVNEVNAFSTSRQVLSFLKKYGECEKERKKYKNGIQIAFTSFTDSPKPL